MITSVAPVTTPSFFINTCTFFAEIQVDLIRALRSKMIEAAIVGRVENSTIIRINSFSKGISMPIVEGSNATKVAVNPRATIAEMIEA